MSAKYVMQEMEDLNGTGRTLLYPRMVVDRCTDTDELARRMAFNTTFSEAEIAGMLHALAREMAEALARGESVKIKGVGTFTASLALKRGKEREEAGGDATRRNARSVEVGGVNYRADKTLVHRTNLLCDLERDPRQPRIARSPHSPEERLRLALAFLDTHPNLHVSDYARLTGLGRTTASIELRRLASDPASGLAPSGFGTHRVYVRRPDPDDRPPTP